ncbi:MAG: hypothetical protein IJK42_02950 [Prevotella sp.]|nr:hypothetical protein [Prevotella sp.]MBQ6208718.1 hypothetical protein [Prevotella sp.]
MKPRTAQVDAGIENFIMGSLVNNGDGTWSQVINPSDDDETEDEPRSKFGFWDL